MSSVSPTYTRDGAPSRRTTDYRPAWLDTLADDVTVEGSLLDGVVQGADAVRAVIVAIRGFYEWQEFNYTGPCGDTFIEEYIAQVRGEPIGCVVLVTRDEDGLTRHIAANYRPLSSVLLLSRLVGEQFAGTPIGEHFLAGD